MAIRDRIKELRRVPASELIPAPNNWRRHPKAQRDALAGVLAEIGFADAVLVRETPDGLTLIDGHLRADIMRDDLVPVLVLDVDADEADKILLTLDPLAAMAYSDQDQLTALLEATSFESDSVNAMLEALANGETEQVPPPEPKEDPGPQMDRAAELQAKWGTALGQVWEIGEHRLMCGDSTKAEDVGWLAGGSTAVLCHADPPYGMGKAIENDNLHGSNLDAFQMRWWSAVRPCLENNGSVYIWGNPEDLWRLWFCGGLKDSERLTLRNEVAWDKAVEGENPTMMVAGVPFEARRMYQPTERCLFFMLGEQGFNENADNYWEGWEPIRSYLEGERLKMGWDIPTMKRIVGHSDLSRDHWTSRSQWSFPTRDVYVVLQTAAQSDAFKRDYDDLKRDFYATRAYFDNTHDHMTDVWQHHRVVGDERWEHETPKPLQIVQRIIKSSSPAGSTLLDPFLGSGTTMVAAEQLGRICYGMEIEPKYVAVALERMSGMGLEPRKVDG